MEQISGQRSYGGWVNRYRHHSDLLDCDMEFGVYLPPAAEHHDVPTLWWLSGLTCTDQNFMQKAGAQRLASELGMAIVCPDTSPRGTDLPGEHDDWDFGSGAGFYVNATKEPWSSHYQMYDYVTRELRVLAELRLPLNDQRAISGHSMGGHGALVCALRNMPLYRSVSAFSPICNPSECGWGIKAFTHYLGKDRRAWGKWDTCRLVGGVVDQLPFLVDQGTGDEFLDEQLKPENLIAACKAADYPLDLRMREGYDHSYYFIASFIDEHLRYHARHLGLLPAKLEQV